MSLDFGLLGSGLVGAAASIFGNAQYNNQQAKLAREANAQQYKMFLDSQAFNRQERLETQDYNRSLMEYQMNYNNPLNQASRLKQAGLNPALVMGDNAGNLQSVTPSSPASSPAAPSYQTPNQVPLLNSGDINNIMNSITGLFNAREDIKGKQINNEFARERQRVEIDKLITEKEKLVSDKDVSVETRRKLGQEIDNLKIDRELLEVQKRRETKAAEYDDRLFSGMVQDYADRHQTALLTNKAQEIANEIQSKFGLKMAEREYLKLGVDIKHAIAEIGLLSEQKNMSHEQYINEIHKRSSIILQNAGIRENNKHFKKIRSDLEQQIQNSTVISNYESAFAGDMNKYWLSNKYRRILDMSFRQIGSYGGNVLGGLFHSK